MSSSSAGSPRPPIATSVTSEELDKARAVADATTRLPSHRVRAELASTTPSVPLLVRCTAQPDSRRPTSWLGEFPWSNPETRLPPTSPLLKAGRDTTPSTCAPGQLYAHAAA